MRAALVAIVLFVIAATFIGVGLRLRADYQQEAREIQPPPAGVQVRYRPLNTPEDIQELTGDRVPPVTYTGRVSLADLPVDEKKRKFFALMLPAVLLARQELADLRAEVRRIHALAEPSDQEQRWLAGMLERYRAEDVPALLRRLADHPNSVVLAQAALESGWGTSRFFREGNNVFGVWSFDENESRMAAGEMRGDRRIYVKTYPSVLGSIKDYFVTIGRGPYRKFRQARQHTDDPLALIDHLHRYSELGDEYVRRLALTIRSNDLQRFDHYRLDPGFIAQRGS